VIGGGFARYSTDDRWLVPHFEKMLYDNALLANAYLHAYLLTGNERYRQVCETTLDFVLREMTDPTGAFYSSLDADSEGEEGKFYLWTYDQIMQILKDPRDVELFIHAYGITPSGNFDGRIVLQRTLDDEALARKFNLDKSEVSTELVSLHSRLLNARNKRVGPGTDDKVITSWNALMLLSFSEAARYFGREDYKLVAMRNGSFLLTALMGQGQLFRSYRAGKVSHSAFLEDYACLCMSMLSLYQTDPDPAWFRFALNLAEEMIEHFEDPLGGFIDTRDDQEILITRPKDLQDNAIPSGNAMATTALLYLIALQGVSEWRNKIELAITQVQDLTIQYPLAFSQWLCAIDSSISSITEVAVLGELELAETQALRQVVWSHYRPNLIAACSPFPPPDGSPRILEHRPLRNNLPTAYVCRSFVCNHPVITPRELVEQLGNQ
jgi:hypothetical protein